MSTGVKDASQRISGSGRRMPTRSELEQFFATVQHRVELAEAKQRCIDQRLATGFNVFDLIEPDENKLSDILAVLLNPKGAHGQGDLFLCLLFQRLGLGSDTKVTKSARVHREVVTHGILKCRRRMDVLVEADALLAIENKVDSVEQPDQVADYLEHLERCRQGGCARSTLIYLTPDGRLPKSLTVLELERRQKSGTLHCWSYPKELRAWLEACRRDCQAQRIRDFLLDFIAYIDSALWREPTASEKLAPYECQAD